MKKILAIILYDKNDLIVNNRRIRIIEYLKKIVPKNEQLYIIDLTEFYSGKLSKKKFRYLDKKIKYFKPKKVKELKKFSKDKIIYGVGPINPKINNYYTFFILKYCSIKLVFINFYGYYLESNYKSNFAEKTHLFFNFKLNYYLNRMFVVFNIFPKIEYYFESSQIRINFLNNSFSKKFDKYFSFFKISLFKNILRINSIYYDEMLTEKKIPIKQKKIVLIDSGPAHPDTFEKDKNLDLINENYVNEFYNKVEKFLKFLNKKSKLKTIFCKHPKTYYPKNIFKNKKYILLSNNADKEIFDAKYVVFTGGSTMFNKAIILNKKIIALVSNLTVKLAKQLMADLDKIFKLNYVDIDNFNIKKFKTNSIKFDKKKYDKFIKNNLIYKSEHSSVLMRKVLFDE